MSGSSPIGPFRRRRSALEELRELACADVAFWVRHDARARPAAWDAVGASIDEQMRALQRRNDRAPVGTVLEDADLTRPVRAWQQRFFRPPGLVESSARALACLRDTWRPLPVHDQRSLVLFRGSLHVATIGLLRCAGRPFERSDVARAQRRRVQIETAFHRETRAELDAHPEGAGHLVLDERGEIVHASALGREWCSLHYVAEVLGRGIGSSDRRVERGVELSYTPMRGTAGRVTLASVAAASRLSLARDAELTELQRRIAALAAGGASTKAIAAELSRSPETVKTHLKKIYQRLDVATRSELARALESGSRFRPLG